MTALGQIASLVSHYVASTWRGAHFGAQSIAAYLERILLVRH